MRMRESLIVSGGLLGFTAILTWQTLQLSPVARLVPTFVILPTLVLFVISLVREMVRTLAVEPNSGSESQHRWIVLGWVALLPVLCGLIGLVPAIFGYSAAYFRVWLRLSLVWAVSMAVLFAVAIYGLSYLAVNQRGFEGWVWSILSVTT